MSFFKFIFISILLFSNQIFSQIELSNQMNAVLENEKIDTSEKIKKLQNLLILNNRSSNSVETGILFSKIGEKYYENGNKEKTIASFKKSINLLEKHKKTQLKVLNETRIKLANIYKEENKKEYYSIINQIINDKGNDLLTINAIAIQAKKGDYYTGINRLNALLTHNNSIDKQLYIRKTIIKIYAYMHESNFNIKLKSDLKIIKEHQKKIEDNFYKSNLDEVFIYGVYNNLANIYDAFGDIETALQLYLKAKSYYTKNGEKVKMLDVTNNLGYLYSRKKDFKQAKLCFQEVIDKSTDEYQLATAYDNMGFFLFSDSLKEKIYYFQKAIQTILDRNEVIYTTPSLEEIRETGYQQDVLIFLIDLADHYVKAYKNTNNNSYLLQAKESLYRIDELVSLIRYESNTEQSKLFWIEKGVNTYMLAVEVCYLINKPDEAFYFMEKNKALLLQENIKMLQAKLEFDIPKELQEKEYKLHYELMALEKKFQNNSNNSLLKLEYSKKNKEYTSFMNALQQKYPAYAKIKQNIEIISIDKAIKNNISKNECFITYILSENYGYGIFCTTEEKIFFQIKDVPAFQKKVLELKNYMKKRFLDKNETIAFQKLSNSVFKTLFPFKNAISKIKNNKVIIVPDDTLLNIPFEALSINMKSLAESYLVNITEVSYLQSFSVFESIKQKKNKPNNKLLAIAPLEFEDNDLQELSRSKDAMEALKVYSSSEIFTGNKATKDNFYKYASDYEIIHLNTHAGVDSSTETPWLSFQKNQLTLNELYGIDIQAELVILDACKTNDGAIVSGEGIISLSRGFFNNGAKSVLASLWNVNEKAGNEIISTFYTELEQGKSKSKALQLAKIKYLKEHQLSEVLPYHWASFTLTGSTTPIVLTRNNFLRNSIIFGLLTIILFVLYRFRNKLFKSKE